MDFLEGYSVDAGPAGVTSRSSRKPVKTYMLETVAHGRELPDLETIVPARVKLERVDDTLYRVSDQVHDGRVIGLIEEIDGRHPVFYTTMPADDSDRWVRNTVDTNPWLDRLWLSSTILYELWRYVQRTVPSHRYVRLGFEHEAWYEAAASTAPEVDTGDDAGGDISDDDDADVVQVERRRSRVQLTERLGVLEDRLPALTQLYDPLHSLVQLQMPSGGRGGHLLHFDGKATNRSDSFLEHRSTVAFVLGLYRRTTEAAEDRLWVETTDAGGDGFRIEGAPVVVQFRQALATPTFNRFVDLGLRRRTSRFRIGGFVQRRGPTKVQLAAIDRHLWQPFLMEATNQQLMAVLPHGTCGNTIHRLVTNVQRFLDPDVEVWLGSERYSAVVTESLRAAA
jgi:hypothetical protein